jgi:hypothetical protein
VVERVEPRLDADHHAIHQEIAQQLASAGREEE